MIFGSEAVDETTTGVVVESGAGKVADGSGWADETSAVGDGATVGRDGWSDTEATGADAAGAGLTAGVRFGEDERMGEGTEGTGFGSDESVRFTTICGSEASDATATGVVLESGAGKAGCQGSPLGTGVEVWSDDTVAAEGGTTAGRDGLSDTGATGAGAASGAGLTAGMGYGRGERMGPGT
jgi:hypothetical protein